MAKSRNSFLLIITIIYALIVLVHYFAEIWTDLFDELGWFYWTLWLLYIFGMIAWILMTYRSAWNGYLKNFQENFAKIQSWADAANVFKDMLFDANKGKTGTLAKYWTGAIRSKF